ncbi:hypothetical protein LDENG_00257440, partial [Lucifuga dentata]
MIVAAACGRNHTLALTEDGATYSFGENKLGQLGQGNQTDAVLSPAPISYNGQPLVKVACGAEFSMVVDCKGNLYSFGCPEYGQLGMLRTCAIPLLFEEHNNNNNINNNN